MELWERKNISEDVKEELQNEFKSIGFEFNYFESQSSSSLVVDLNNCLYKFEDFKECFETFKPIIKEIALCKEHIALQQRNLRLLLKDSIDQVTKSFDLVTYSFSIGKPYDRKQD